MSPLASRPFMRILSLLFVVALAFCNGACEKQPLPGDPHPAETHEGAEHAEKSGAATEKHEEAAKPAGETKSEEAPKFFPDKK